MKVRCRKCEQEFNLDSDKEKLFKNWLKLDDDQIEAYINKFKYYICDSCEEAEIDTAYAKDERIRL